MSLQIRTYEPGDEAIQAAIYNKAAERLPGFKPASAEDVRRRVQVEDFDPRDRMFAVAHGEVVGYCAVQPNGRVGYPWCLPGHAAEELLFDAAVDRCRARGIRRAFAAYRQQWSVQQSFLEKHGFYKKRDVVNFVQNMIDLPTQMIRRGLNVSPLQEGDLETVAALGNSILTLPADQLHTFYFHNPYFSADSVFTLRRADGVPQAIGLLIANSSYADPLDVDPEAPCYRLGAFGAEGMTTKRIRGLYSYLARNDADAIPLGLDLLSYAMQNLKDDALEVLAAQAPSDAPHLLSFYTKYFRKQGSFPVHECDLR